MDSLSPRVAVRGRTVMTPVVEFCLEDLTWMNLMSATCLSGGSSAVRSVRESTVWVQRVNRACVVPPTWSWWRSGAWWSVIGWGSGTPGWTGGPARWRSERRRTTPRTWHTEQTCAGQTAGVLTNNITNKWLECSYEAAQRHTEFWTVQDDPDLWMWVISRRGPGVSELFAGRESQQVVPALWTHRPPDSAPLHLQDGAPPTQTHWHTIRQTEFSLMCFLLNTEESQQTVR